MVDQLQEQGFRFQRQSQDGLVIDALPDGTYDDDPVAADTVCHTGLQTALNRIHPDHQRKIISLVVRLCGEEADADRVGICREYGNSHKIVLSRGLALAGKELYPA